MGGIGIRGIPKTPKRQHQLNSRERSPEKQKTRRTQILSSTSSCPVANHSRHKLASIRKLISAEDKASPSESQCTTSIEQHESENSFYDNVSHELNEESAPISPTLRKGKSIRQERESRNRTWRNIRPYLAQALNGAPRREFRTHVYAQEAHNGHSGPAICSQKSWSFLAVCFEGFKIIHIEWCSCLGITIPEVIIQHGFFPSTPTRPTTAFSLKWMKFFHNCFMNGSQKYPLVKGLTVTLEAESTNRLPSLHRRFEQAYFNWLKTDEEASRQFSYAIVQHEDVVLPGGLISQCPPCANRDESETSSAFVVYMDGNAQHRRRGDVSKGNSVEERGSTFVDTSHLRVLTRKPETATTTVPAHRPSWLAETEDNTIHPYGDSTNPLPPPLVPSPLSKTIEPAICPNAFLAASANLLQKHQKPPSMAKLDETGVFGVVCRHGTPLVFADLYRGENYDTAHIALQHVVSKINDIDCKARIFVEYDIACRFQPWLANHYPLLASRIVFSLPNFHVFSHSFQCQMKLGPLTITGLGRSNGELVETSWSKKTSFVKVCRISSPQARHDILHSHNLYYAYIRKPQLPMTLTEMYERADKEIEECNESLSLYFSIWCVEHSEVSDMNNDQRKREFGNDLRRRVKQNLSVINEQDKYLTALTDGRLHLFPEHETFTQLCRSQKKPLGPEFTWELPSRQSLQGNQFLRQLLEADRLQLQEWIPSHPKWQYYCVDAVMQSLHKIKQKIKIEYAARILENDRINYHFKGQNEAREMIRNRDRRHQKMRNLINSYNDLLGWVRGVCEEECRRNGLDQDDFMIQADDYDIHTIEASAGEQLWAFDRGYEQFYSKKVWFARQPEILRAVEAMQKLSRCQEEIEMIGREMDRLGRWTCRELRIAVRIANSTLHPMRSSYRLQDYLNSTTRLAQNYIFMNEKLGDLKYSNSSAHSAELRAIWKSNQSDRIPLLSQKCLLPRRPAGGHSSISLPTNLTHNNTMNTTTTCLSSLDSFSCKAGGPVSILDLSGDELSDTDAEEKVDVLTDYERRDEFDAIDLDELLETM